MAETAGQEKTEKATSKKRQEARNKGQVAISREVSSAAVLLTSLGVFYFVGSWLFWNLSGVITQIFENIGALRFNTINDASVFSIEVLNRLLTILMPVLLPLAVLGLAANILQVGFKITTQAMAPTFKRLNPISGMKRFASLKALVELTKSILKILFIGTIAYLLVKGEMQAFPLLVHQEVGQILVFIAQVSLKICFFVCLALVLLAIVDFFYQRWQFEEDLKMTKQEVRDEQKQTMGDPKVKSRIRSMQLEMARRRMMEAVPEADVVITTRPI